MAFTGLKNFGKKKKEEFMFHVSPEIKKLAERKKEFHGQNIINYGANSYEKKLLVKNLTTPALIKLSEYYLSQTGMPLREFELSKHYNDAVIREFAPLLISRLNEQIKINQTNKG